MSNHRKRKNTMSEDDRHARDLREMLADKEGDEDWKRVPFHKLYQFFGPEGTRDLEAESEDVLSESYTPSSFIDEDVSE